MTNSAPSIAFEFDGKSSFSTFCEPIACGDLTVTQRIVLKVSEVQSDTLSRNGISRPKLLRKQRNP
tara:strand:+ start:1945 stop:2142 length:198 start_codon:yes stop_codon:yes gene_type:complete